jgi:hypothetical protein
MTRAAELLELLGAAGEKWHTMQARSAERKAAYHRKQKGRFTDITKSKAQKKLKMISPEQYKAFRKGTIEKVAKEFGKRQAVKGPARVASAFRK